MKGRRGRSCFCSSDWLVLVISYCFRQRNRADFFFKSFSVNLEIWIEEKLVKVVAR